MITGRDFIVFSDDWGRHPCSCQHIISRFLAGNRVLWVNTLGMRNPRLTLYDLRRSLEKVRGWFTAASATDQGKTIENLTVIKPIVTPYGQFALLRLRNRRSVTRSVRKAMQKLNFSRPIVVVTLPNAVDYLGAFDEAASIYYCVDEFTEWPGLDRRYVAMLEEKLLRTVSLVCATAEPLCREKTRNSRVPHYLPHGVDFFHFAAAETSKPVSKERPVIGFFGAISPWLDFSLLRKLIAMRPDLDFVLIGPVDVDPAELGSFSNLHLTGKIPYADLPQQAAAFDVALIPFLVNDLTCSVNPLKFMEYLACGLPVVATPLPEVARRSGFVELAENAEAFSAAIDRLLAEDSEEKRQRRRKLARQHSWENVAERFSVLIECLPGVAEGRI